MVEDAEHFMAKYPEDAFYKLEPKML